jgi:excinuclease ABC subunit C
VRTLQKEMADYAKALEFEKAQQIKRTLFALSHIYDVSLLKKEAMDVSASLDTFRIEAYDVAHLSGKDVVGVMTVLEDGLPTTNEYRQFKLSIERNDDGRNLEEILTRRLKHSEWRLPNLIVVDGFELQMNIAHRVLAYYQLDIPVVGVVKDAHHNPKDILGESVMAEKYHDSILLANSEAHRFAIAFHRKRRAQSFILTKKKK